MAGHILGNTIELKTFCTRSVSFETPKTVFYVRLKLD